MTVLINFFGSPSSGKTTLSAALFTRLKVMGVNVEYTPEYVKGWVYESRPVGKYGQFTIFGEEVRRQSRLFNTVDIAISDSPVALTGFYNYFYSGRQDNCLSSACKEFYRRAQEEDNIQVINFLLPKRNEYVSGGRYQSESEAAQVNIQLKEWLNKEGYNYTLLDCPDSERVDVIINKLQEVVGDLNGLSMV